MGSREFCRYNHVPNIYFLGHFEIFVRLIIVWKWHLRIKLPLPTPFSCRCQVHARYLLIKRKQVCVCCVCADTHSLPSVTDTRSHPSLFLCNRAGSGYILQTHVSFPDQWRCSCQGVKWCLCPSAKKEKSKVEERKLFVEKLEKHWVE